MNKVIAGIDVAKDHLDIYVAPGPVERFANTPPGRERLISWARRHAVEQVACDASGGYERRFIEALHDAPMLVNLVHSKRAKDFAHALGREAKTDGLDARTLAEMTQHFALPPTPRREPASQAIRDLVGRRDQLVRQQVQEKNRLEKEPEQAVAESCERMIEHLGEEIERMEQACREVLATNPELAHQAALYESVKGIGKTTALALLAYLPELGQHDYKGIVALAGLAPYARDSGRQHNKRSIRGGRSAVRRALYMASLSASQYNPQMCAFHKRLRARGKPGKVAQTAVMRKLLLQLHAVAKRGTPWVEDYTPTCEKIA